MPLIWRKQCALTRRYAEFGSLLIGRIYNIPDCTVNRTFSPNNSLLTTVIYSSYIGIATIGGVNMWYGQEGMGWDGG